MSLDYLSTSLPVASILCSFLVFVQVLRQFQTHVYPLKHQYKWSLIAVFVALLYLGVENIYLGWLDPPKQHLLAISEHTTLSIQMALICFVVVLAPMIEEILFRGLLFHALEEKPQDRPLRSVGFYLAWLHRSARTHPTTSGIGLDFVRLRFKSNSMVPHSYCTWSTMVWQFYCLCELRLCVDLRTVST